MSSWAKAGIEIGVALVTHEKVSIGVPLFRRKRRVAAANKLPAAVELGEAYRDMEPGGNGHSEKKGSRGSPKLIELITTARLQELGSKKQQQP